MERMDIISMKGCSRSPVFLTASSSHLGHPPTCMLHCGVSSTPAAAAVPGLLPATVAVLGSGDFSKGITSRLLRCGFKVVVGSRRPKLASHSFPHVVDVSHYEEALRKSNVVFLALHREHYSQLWDLKHLMAGTITLPLRESSLQRNVSFKASVVQHNGHGLVRCGSRTEEEGQTVSSD